MRTQGKMKILHLPIKRKWFNLIARGEKKIEYREYKLHFYLGEILEIRNWKKSE